MGATAGAADSLFKYFAAAASVVVVAVVVVMLFYQYFFAVAPKYFVHVYAIWPSALQSVLATTPTPCTPLLDLPLPPAPLSAPPLCRELDSFAAAMT